MLWISIVYKWAMYQLSMLFDCLNRMFYSKYIYSKSYHTEILCKVQCYFNRGSQSWKDMKILLQCDRIWHLSHVLHVISLQKRIIPDKIMHALLSLFLWYDACDHQGIIWPQRELFILKAGYEKSFGKSDMARQLFITCSFTVALRLHIF